MGITNKTCTHLGQAQMRALKKLKTSKFLIQKVAIQREQFASAKIQKRNGSCKFSRVLFIYQKINRIFVP